MKNNKKTIEAYNRAVQEQNKAKQAIRRQLQGSAKLSGGRVVKYGGKVQKMTKSDIRVISGDVFTELKPYNIERGLTDEQIRKRTQRIKQTTKELNGQRKKSLFKSNYLKGMEKQKADGTITPEQFEQIKKNVKKLDTAELLKWFYREEYSQIGFTYSIDEESQARQQTASAGLVKSLNDYTKRVTKTKGVK